MPNWQDIARAMALVTLVIARVEMSARFSDLLDDWKNPEYAAE